MPRRILVPLPDCDFDVTEVAVPWRFLQRAGHQVVFSTENGGRRPEADPRLLTGVVFGQLGAADEPKRWYEDLRDDASFSSPTAWGDLDVSDFDALLLPGGHAPGMKQYLGSKLLQRHVATFWRLRRPVGAICHGVVVLSRAHDPDSGRSVLADVRTTSLTKRLERGAYWATSWRLGRYYRTYPAYVEDEVRSVLTSPQQFDRGPLTLRRDNDSTVGTGFIVRDGHYLSARWPGDAYTFAAAFTSMVNAL